MSATTPDLIIPEGAGETQTFQKLPCLPPNAITSDLIVPEGTRETQVFEELLSLSPSATPQEKGAQIAAFIKPQDDPALAYNAFQVAVKIAMALPPGSQDDLTLVPSEIIKALNSEELISKIQVDQWMRDAWNCDETHPGWEGLNTLTLRLLLSNFRSLSAYAFWAISDTLERPRPLKPRVAITWWVRASRVLYEEAAAGESELGSGHRWTGVGMIDAERWARWEDRVCVLCEGGLTSGAEDTRVFLKGGLTVVNPRGTWTLPLVAQF